jgi:hypothetical protein
VRQHALHRRVVRVPGVPSTVGVPISRSTAARAIASVGWRIVVSGGQTRLLAGESSKPAIARSPGIARPWRCAAASTPSAMSSLLAKTAVGWWRSLSSWCVAATPDSKRKSPSITSSGAISRARRASP